MKVNIVPCIFVNDSKKNDNIRKSDIQELKLLVSNNNILPRCELKNNDIKNSVRNFISKLINACDYHIEQVYTFENNDIDIVYLIALNIVSVKDINDGYKLIDFKIVDNKDIVYGDKIIKYHTMEEIGGNNIVYKHIIDNVNDELNLSLVETLTVYKKIRSSLDSTDLIFKFMPKYFTLEDVRVLYEFIKDIEVDKSNFRKKIIKYVEKKEDMKIDKGGYRPSSYFSFKLLKGDKWI